MKNKIHCVDDSHLSKKVLISDIKLAIYFGTILVGITLAWSSTTNQLQIANNEIIAISRKLDAIDKIQTAMQNQVDVLQTKVDLHIADQSATIR